ncbi:MAG: DUF6660 family protein [Bacteroidota bacterium]
MRIFTTILCIYITLLTLLPCADAAEHVFKSQYEMLSISETHDDDCADNSCSIFCQCVASCSCAGGAPSIAVFKSGVFLPQNTLHTFFSSLSVSPSKGFPGSSWRPPQI